MHWIMFQKEMKIYFGLTYETCSDFRHIVYCTQAPYQAFRSLSPSLTICRFALRRWRDTGQWTTCSYRLLRAHISFLVILYFLCSVMDFVTFIHSCITILIRICCLPHVRQSLYPVMYVSLFGQFDVHLRCDNPTLVGMLTQTHIIYAYVVSCFSYEIVKLRMDLGGMF